ncbi:lecithin-cholesterol acyltransferase-like 1 [Vitis vinifera]|uniref:lecithin-cholesterol acyltransferase-like 1 n=1 Tax=Vitis vinifera TaxID=29760 RepID=UPI00015C8160|nr:lecithin-cholesterol acyltransferase-like 1 [Vitis vinifera]|eukprot:XP_002283444.2 PREDICTED: lecithin-cholesterol acyltransferase-like 1 [Vitis vinifera]
MEMKGLGLIMGMVSMAVMWYECQASSNLHPLILVPGSGGNQLEARLTDGYKPSSLLCSRSYPPFKDKEGWFRLWFRPALLVSPFTQCFADRMTLYYDPQLDDYVNTPGVETRVPSFGSTRSLLYLDPHLKRVTAYMGALVKALEHMGYVDGKTLFGAPYDFRYGLAADGHPSRVGSKFLEDLKDLIEKASTSNGGKPVILVSHSLGGLFVLQLLNRNPPSWRQKFIKHFVALATPWGGAVQEVHNLASGYTLGAPLVDPLLVRGQQRSSESNLWLIPSPKVFGAQPFAVTLNATYTANDVVQFLNDIGFSGGIHPYQSRIVPLLERLPAPAVPVTCIFGSGVKTAETLFYDESGFDKQPEIVYGDGDGTVNMVSLEALQLEWADQQNQPLKTIRIEGASHISIFQDEKAVNRIVKEISGINSDIHHVKSLIDQ